MTSSRRRGGGRRRRDWRPSEGNRRRRGETGMDDRRTALSTLSAERRRRSEHAGGQTGCVSGEGKPSASARRGNRTRQLGVGDWSVSGGESAKGAIERSTPAEDEEGMRRNASRSESVWRGRQRGRRESNRSRRGRERANVDRRTHANYAARDIRLVVTTDSVYSPDNPRGSHFVDRLPDDADATLPNATESDAPGGV